jgi:hypothetical protein
MKAQLQYITKNHYIRFKNAESEKSCIKTYKKQRLYVFWLVAYVLALNKDMRRYT